ncbi:hypothetical protein KAZ66_01005 [Candidatus Woesebacteria bacterium]|jgi:sugar diacid utilization regulator|nr:hypothetical protein [Candidatus Woesebacteria bacterium]
MEFSKIEDPLQAFIEERQKEADKTGINPARLQKRADGVWCVDGIKVTVKEHIDLVNRNADILIEKQNNKLL